MQWNLITFIPILHQVSVVVRIKVRILKRAFIFHNTSFNYYIPRLHRHLAIIVHSSHGAFHENAFKMLLLTLVAQNTWSLLADSNHSGKSGLSPRFNCYSAGQSAEYKDPGYTRFSSDMFNQTKVQIPNWIEQPSVI